MTRIRLGSGDLVVVCDGRKALILENQGDEKFPNLRTREVREHDDAQTRAQGSDAPGRVQLGTVRSAVEQTDWHDLAERAFLQSLAGHLDATLRNAPSTSFVIVAPPRALGVLRKAYSPALAQAVKTEVHKDWVKTPIHEIEKSLTE